MPIFVCVSTNACGPTPVANQHCCMWWSAQLISVVLAADSVDSDITIRGHIEPVCEYAATRSSSGTASARGEILQIKPSPERAAAVQAVENYSLQPSSSQSAAQPMAAQSNYNNNSFQSSAPQAVAEQPTAAYSQGTDVQLAGQLGSSGVSMLTVGLLRVIRVSMCSWGSYCSIPPAASGSATTINH